MENKEEVLEQVETVETVEQIEEKQETQPETVKTFTQEEVDAIVAKRLSKHDKSQENKANEVAKTLEERIKDLEELNKQSSEELTKERFNNKMIAAGVDETQRGVLLNSIGVSLMDDFDVSPFVKVQDNKQTADGYVLPEDETNKDKQDEKPETNEERLKRLGII